METFKTTGSGTILFVKVSVDTVKPATTKIYEIENGKRVKPHLLFSEEYENGSIDLDTNDQLQFRAIGNKANFVGSQIEIYTIVQNLPESITTNEAARDYALENIRIKYWLREDAHDDSYVFGKDDKVSLLTERTAILYKYINIL